jgi:hypothetical protein
MVKSLCLCLSFCHQSLPGVEFLKGVFNFNLFTNVQVLVRSCLLETPTPNWDVLFTDCTIEFSNSRGSAGLYRLYNRVLIVQSVKTSTTSRVRELYCTVCKDQHYL